MAKYRPLTQPEIECAQRLKVIYLARKKEWGLSQEALGNLVDMSQSAVGQYLNAHIPMGLPAKLAFAMALKCEASEIDPDIKFSLPPEGDEQALLEAYRRAPERGKRLILEVSETAAGGYQKDSEQDPEQKQ